jgi:hypothetical protein
MVNISHDRLIMMIDEDGKMDTHTNKPKSKANLMQMLGTNVWMIARRLIIS